MVMYEMFIVNSQFPGFDKSQSMCYHTRYDTYVWTRPYCVGVSNTNIAWHVEVKIHGGGSVGVI